MDGFYQKFEKAVVASGHVIATLFAFVIFCALFCMPVFLSEVLWDKYGYGRLSQKSEIGFKMFVTTIHIIIWLGVLYMWLLSRKGLL